MSEPTLPQRKLDHAQNDGRPGNVRKLQKVAELARLVVRRSKEFVTEREWGTMEAAGGRGSELLGIHAATLASRLRALGVRGGRWPGV